MRTKVKWLVTTKFKRAGKNESPIVGKKNAIEITITKATIVDKKSNHDHGYMMT